MSIATEVWQIYLFFGIIVGLGSAFGLYLTCTTVVNNWFIRKRSLGMGLVISAGDTKTYHLVNHNPVCRQLLCYGYGDRTSSGISEGYRFFSHCGSNGPGPYSGNEHIMKTGAWLFRG